MGRPIKAHLCKKCKDTDPSNFTTSYKNICRKCSNVVYKDDRLLSRRLATTIQTAKRKKLEVTIDLDFIKDLLVKQDHKCYISKIPLSLESNSPYSISFDRIDSSKGYTKDNVGLVVKFINVAKSNYSLTEF